MGKNKFDLILSTFLVSISISYLFFVVFQNRYFFNAPFNFKVYEKKYNQSQWVIPNSKNPISDEDLYTYAGYKYIKGLNPILLNPEAPPLGKYLIGLSILLFNNQRVVSLIISIFSLLLIFLLIYINISSIAAASLAVFFTSINTLFADQFIHSPQLDIFQLFFLLLFSLFFTIFQKLKNYKYLFFAGFFFGGFISIKFFLMYFSLINASLIIYYFFKKQTIKKALTQIVIINGIGLIIYVLTYFRYFILGGTIRSFLGTQKWIVLFYSSSQIDITKLLGNYLSLIFFNRWRFWIEGYPTIHYQYWSMLWPIIFVLGLFSVYKLIKDKKTVKNNLVFFIVSFILVYNILLFITPVYPRYLLLLFVPLNILIAIYFGRIFR